MVARYTVPTVETNVGGNAAQMLGVAQKGFAQIGDAANNYLDRVAKEEDNKLTQQIKQMQLNAAERADKLAKDEIEFLKAKNAPGAYGIAKDADAAITMLQDPTKYASEDIQKILKKAEGVGNLSNDEADQLKKWQDKVAAFADTTLSTDVDDVVRNIAQTMPNNIYALSEASKVRDANALATKQRLAELQKSKMNILSGLSPTGANLAKSDSTKQPKANDYMDIDKLFKESGIDAKSVDQDTYNYLKALRQTAFNENIDPQEFNNLIGNLKTQRGKDGGWFSDDVKAGISDDQKKGLLNRVKGLSRISSNDVSKYDTRAIDNEIARLKMSSTDRAKAYTDRLAALGIDKPISSTKQTITPDTKVNKPKDVDITEPKVRSQNIDIQVPKTTTDTEAANVSTVFNSYGNSYKAAAVLAHKNKITQAEAKRILDSLQKDKKAKEQERLDSIDTGYTKGSIMDWISKQIQ